MEMGGREGRRGAEVRLGILVAALRPGEGVVKGCRRGVKQPDLGKRPTTSAIRSPWVWV